MMADRIRAASFLVVLFCSSSSSRPAPRRARAARLDASPGCAPDAPLRDFDELARTHLDAVLEHLIRRDVVPRALGVRPRPLSPP